VPSSFLCRGNSWVEWDHWVCWLLFQARSQIWKGRMSALSCLSFSLSVSLSLSVRPSVWNKSADTGMISMKFDTLCIFRKYVENIPVALNSYKNCRCFAWGANRATKWNDGHQQFKISARLMSPTTEFYFLFEYFGFNFGSKIHHAFLQSWKLAILNFVDWTKTKQPLNSYDIKIKKYPSMY